MKRLIPTAESYSRTDPSAESRAFRYHKLASFKLICTTASYGQANHQVLGFAHRRQGWADIIAEGNMQLWIA
jgi:hypothetical protein